MIAFSFIDYLSIDNELQGSAAIAVAPEQILVAEVVGAFVRHTGKVLLISPLDGVRASWSSFAAGFRRSLAISFPVQLDLVFGPLWYREMDAVKRAMNQADAA